VKNSTEIILKLRAMADARNVEGMARFGISPRNTLGVTMPRLRTLAKETGRDHVLAQELWASGVHEARILACLIDEPRQVTEQQMDNWVKDFESWDICDQCCANIFEKTPFRYKKAVEWVSHDEEFIRRAGFVMMAVLAVHDKKADDTKFLELLPLIQQYSADERNFVRKAVNWALRQIGKRNAALNRSAVAAATEIQKIDSKTARWIAADALRELKSDAVQAKVNKAGRVITKS
jgi:3-methyladenine DNA glycosylase AlkD